MSGPGQRKSLAELIRQPVPADPEPAAPARADPAQAHRQRMEEIRAAGERRRRAHEQEMEEIRAGRDRRHQEHVREMAQVSARLEALGCPPCPPDPTSEQRSAWLDAVQEHGRRRHQQWLEDLDREHAQWREDIDRRLRRMGVDTSRLPRHSLVS